MPSSSLGIERARPLLGTTVSIRVHGLDDADAHAAISDAFAEITLVHRLMSFHEADSDVSRLNREAMDHPVDVHPATFEVLQLAEEIAHASDGCFDITVAPELVEQGLLPSPLAIRRPPDREATWRNIRLGPRTRVRFHRPLWIDLGGIAKGYAVDRAMALLRARGAVQACVNAGGDLSIYGPEIERVLLTTGGVPEEALPVLEIENAAVASSGNSLGQHNGGHFDGRSRRAVEKGRFVSVVAERCVVADALTKVVIALQEQSEPHLHRLRASAHLHDSRHGWRHFPADKA